jgi:hypothetical protein
MVGLVALPPNPSPRPLPRGPQAHCQELPFSVKSLPSSGLLFHQNRPSPPATGRASRPLVLVIFDFEMRPMVNRLTWVP